MKCKHLKLIMELIFIFILPLLFILPALSINNDIVYDNNGNFVVSTKKIEYSNLGYYQQYRNVIEDFNIWDEEWDSGSIDSNGQNVVSSGFRSKNYIPIDSAKSYFPCVIGSDGSSLVIYFYDSDKNSVIYSGTSAFNNGYNGVEPFTPPNNARYIRFRTSGLGDTYNHNICINVNVSWANGNYEPYGEPFVLVSYTNYTGDAEIVKSPLFYLKDLALDIFKLDSNNVIVNILFDYTTIWLLMFILWHFVYLVFDFIVHLLDKERRRE